MTILLFLILIITGFAFNALLLNVTTKIFKTNGANYKTSLIISIFQWLFALITSVLLAVLGLGSISIVITILFGLIIFHKLLQKYYQTSFKKNIAIYAVFTVITVIVSLLIIIPTRSFIIEPFTNKGKSMEPTYQDGDYLMINKFDKNFKRGDLVVFKNPKKPEQYSIKRIVGLPGEKIQLKNDAVYIYNTQNPNGYKLPEPYLLPDIKTTGIDENIVQLNNNEYYLLGDNRPISMDSRVFGSVSSEYFNGKVWFKANKK